jgi:hypothetical protein
MLSTAVIPGVSPSTEDAVKRAVARAAWQWYEDHKDDEIISRKLWFFTVRLYVRDLTMVFTQLFGAPQR